MVYIQFKLRYILTQSLCSKTQIYSESHNSVLWDQQRQWIEKLDIRMWVWYPCCIITDGQEAHGKDPFLKSVIRDLNFALLSMKSITARKTNLSLPAFPRPPPPNHSKPLVHRLPQQTWLLSILVNSLTDRADHLRILSRPDRYESKKPTKPIVSGESHGVN